MTHTKKPCVLCDGHIVAGEDKTKWGLDWHRGWIHFDCAENLYDAIRRIRGLPEVVALETELARIKERQHQHTYCAYCGEEFPTDIRHAVEAVGKHIDECPKHPIAKYKSDLAQAKAENVRLREEVEEKCKDLDWEAQELLLTEKENDLNRASAYHYAIDMMRVALEANDDAHA